MITLGERAELALRAVREAPILAYDTEGSGLDWKRNQAVGYVITPDRNNSWYIPVRHGGGGNLVDRNCTPLVAADKKTPRHSFEVELAAAFEERRQRGFVTVGHYIGFDAHFSANEGIMLGRNLEDTGINEALLDEYSRSFSLDSCAKAHGVTAKKGDELYKHMALKFGGEAERNQMGNFWRLSGDDPIAVEYAAGDGLTTFELREAQNKKLNDEGLSFIHNIESQLIWTVFRVERRGIRVDIDRLQQVRDEITRRIATAMQKLPPRFNPRSSTQMKKLMEDTGHTDWPSTELGNPSFTEKWLKKHDTGRAVIDVRQLTNLENSFLSPLAERHLFEGRVFSTLNQMKTDDYGTISGRFSCSNPNMQQVPKRNKELGRLFRSIFIPDEGMELYECDYSQCEPRLFAHYAQEPVLLAGYSADPPRDVHQVVADMFRVERDPTAKRMNMGIFTGMQAKALAAHMGWDIPYATEMWNKWFSEFSGIRTFQNDAKNKMKERGYVWTLLKRKCRLDHPQFAYRATSKIIQGSNADIVKRKMLDMDMILESSGDPMHILMTIHDAFTNQAPKSSEGRAMINEMTRICCDVQTPPYNLRVPFVMDVGHGPNWAEATYGEEKHG